jgi:predicted Rossmann fold nucleotide-binding protein DprA/Smf involved in DNA uptake
MFEDKLKIGIVGTRSRNTYTDHSKVLAMLYKAANEKGYDCDLYTDKTKIMIISGGCSQGGDRFANIIAKNNGIPIYIVYPDWNQFGKSAGFIRNSDIAQLSDIIIACVAENRKGGTEDTIKKAEKLGKPVYLVK